ncbi:MAG: hypothetical protein GY756_27550 [bacterium]|nr:hypothetical protein [bacterium]
MNNQEEIKLSSSWTNVGIYGGALLSLICLPIIIFVMISQEFHIGMAIGGFFLLLLIGFVIYKLVFACDARIIGERLVLKKQFRSAKSYTFDKIGYPTSFRLKSTIYITVEMKNDDNSLEKYLIINSRSLLSFENIDAEQTLISLRINAGAKK